MVGKQVHLAEPFDGETEKTHVAHLPQDAGRDSFHSTQRSDADKGSIASRGAEGAAFAKERARAERRLLFKLGEGLH